MILLFHSYVSTGTQIQPIRIHLLSAGVGVRVCSDDGFFNVENPSLDTAAKICVDFAVVLDAD